MIKNEFEDSEKQEDGVGLELGDLICEILTFCYSEAHKANLEKDARAMPGNPTFEQFIAAALAYQISEKFEVRRKCSPEVTHN